MPAAMTAKIVIASAARLMLVRHFCRNRKRMALMSVPAWPIPIQKTKPVMSQAQPTVVLLPQTPMPLVTSRPSEPSSTRRMLIASANSSFHFPGVGTSTIWATDSVTE